MKVAPRFNDGVIRALQDNTYKIDVYSIEYTNYVEVSEADIDRIFQFENENEGLFKFQDLSLGYSEIDKLSIKGILGLIPPMFSKPIILTNIDEYSLDKTIIGKEIKLKELGKIEGREIFYFDLALSSGDNCSAPDTYVRHITNDKKIYVSGTDEFINLNFSYAPVNKNFELVVKLRGVRV